MIIKEVISKIKDLDSIKKHLEKMFREMGFAVSRYTLNDIIPNQNFIDEILKFETK